MTICSENSEFRTNFMVPWQYGKNTFDLSQLGRCHNVTMQYPQLESSIWLNISSITPFNYTTFNNDQTPQYDTMLNMFEFPDFNNNNYNKSLNDNLLHLSFTSFQFRNYHNSDNSDDDVYNNEALVAKKDSSILDPSYFLLYPGQAYFITLYPTVIVGECSFNNYLCLYNRYSKLRKLELNPQLNQLPVRLKPNEINFGIRPHSNFFKYEEKKPGYSCNYLQITF